MWESSNFVHARLTLSSQNVFKMSRQAKLHVALPNLILHVLSIQEYQSIQWLLLSWRVHSRFLYILGKNALWYTFSLCPCDDDSVQSLFHMFCWYPLGRFLLVFCGCNQVWMVYFLFFFWILGLVYEILEGQEPLYKHLTSPYRKAWELWKLHGADVSKPKTVLQYIYFKVDTHNTELM